MRDAAVVNISSQMKARSRRNENNKSEQENPNPVFCPHPNKQLLSTQVDEGNTA